MSRKTDSRTTRSGGTTLVLDPPYSLTIYRTGVGQWLWQVALLDPLTGEPAAKVGEGESNLESAARRDADAVLRQHVKMFWRYEDGTTMPVPQSKDDVAYGGYLHRWNQFLHEAEQSKLFNNFVTEKFHDWLLRRNNAKAGEPLESR